jgi:enediyne biosynthesis protein E4
MQFFSLFKKHQIKQYSFLIFVGLFFCGCGGSSSPQPEENEIATSPLCFDDINTSESAFVKATQTVGLCVQPASPHGTTIRQGMTGGVAIGDIDNDGDQDIFITYGMNGTGRLFEYVGNEGYIDITSSSGIGAQSNERGGIFADVDGDGLLDLVALIDASEHILVYRNNGDKTFTDITSSTNLVLTKGAMSVSAADYDRDDDIDLVFSHWRESWGEHSRLEYLWENDGEGRFTDVSEKVDIRPRDYMGDPNLSEELSFTPIFADINQDLYPDLLMAGDFSSSQVLINTMSDLFVDQTTSVISDENGMGASVADFDNDGDLDWFVTSIWNPIDVNQYGGGESGNRLYENDGAGQFVDITDRAGVRQGYWGWGSCFADFNNDGYLDILQTNGMMSAAGNNNEDFSQFVQDPTVLFISNQDGTFTEMASQLGVTHLGQGRGVGCYDYDKDGDIDILLTDMGSVPTLFKNKNFADGNNFITVKLIGKTKNVSAAGARVFVEVGGITMMREIQLGASYSSQVSLEAHFGIAANSIVDEIRVEWRDSDAAISVLENVSSNQFITISYPD